MQAEGMEVCAAPAQADPPPLTRVNLHSLSATMLQTHVDSRESGTGLREHWSTSGLEPLLQPSPPRVSISWGSSSKGIDSRGSLSDRFSFRSRSLSRSPGCINWCLRNPESGRILYAALVLMFAAVWVLSEVANWTRGACYILTSTAVFPGENSLAWLQWFDVLVFSLFIPIVCTLLHFATRSWNLLGREYRIGVVLALVAYFLRIFVNTFGDTWDPSMSGDGNYYCGPSSQLGGRRNCYLWIVLRCLQIIICDVLKIFVSVLFTVGSLRRTREAALGSLLLTLLLYVIPGAVGVIVDSGRFLAQRDRAGNIFMMTHNILSSIFAMVCFKIVLRYYQSMPSAGHDKTIMARRNCTMHFFFITMIMMGLSWFAADFTVAAGIVSPFPNVTANAASPESISASEEVRCIFWRIGDLLWFVAFLPILIVALVRDSTFWRSVLPGHSRISSRTLQHVQSISIAPRALKHIDDIARGSEGIVSRYWWWRKSSAGVVSCSSGSQSRRRITSQVAVKTLHIRMDEDETYEKWSQEVNTMIQLRHPNIVEMFGVCLDPPRLRIVMELCSLGTLRQVMDQGVLIFTEALHLISGVCRGVIHMHRNGMLHLDIKSDNILVAADPLAAKLADFGCSRSIIHSTDETVVGTPGWMSPEQMSNQSLSPQTDSWAIAMVLWEALVWRRPFVRTSEANLRKADREAYAAFYTSEATHDRASIATTQHTMLQSTSMDAVHAAGTDPLPDMRVDTRGHHHPEPGAGRSTSQHMHTELSKGPAVLSMPIIRSRTFDENTLECKDQVDSRMSTFALTRIHVTSGRRPPLPRQLPEELAQLITRCWSSNPEARPLPEEILFTVERVMEQVQTGAMTAVELPMPC